MNIDLLFASPWGALIIFALRIVDVLGRGIDRRPLLDDVGEVALVIDVIGRDRQIEHVAVAEHPGFAGFRQHDEFVAEIATDRAGPSLTTAQSTRGQEPCAR